jgi:hypothetical protein
MLAGSLELQLYADVARIKSDMDKATSIVTSGTQAMGRAAAMAKEALSAIGVGLSIEAFVDFVRGAIEMGDQMEKLAQRTGMTTESLSQLQYAAKLADVPMESLTVGMKKLAVSIAQGLSGDQTKIAMFRQLGVTTADLGKGTEAVMLKMADGYATAKDGAGKAAISIGLMGKAGDELIPLLNGGSDAIRRMKAEADQLGLTIGKEFAEASSQFMDNMNRIHALSGATAIMLGKDLVESTRGAMQAFIDAAKAGDRFGGTLEAIRTFLRGDDQHRANVTLVEDTDKLLAAQNDLDRLKRQGYSEDSMAVVSQRAKIKGLQDEISTTLVYKHALEGQAEADKAAAEAAKQARANGKTLGVPNAAAQSEYDSLIKKINEKIAADKAELATGRQQSEFEKFYTKTLEDAKSAKVGLTAAQLAAIKVHLDEAKAIDNVLQAQKAQHANDATFAKQIGDAKQEQADFDAAQALRAGQLAFASRDETLALKDQNKEYQAERSLIAASDAERTLAIDNLRVEAQLRKDLQALHDDETIDKETRAQRKADLEKNAASAKELNAFKAQTEEMRNVWGHAFTNMEDALVNFVATGKLNFSSLIDGMISDLARLAIHQMITKPLWDAISGSSFFSSFGGLFGLGNTPSAFAPGGVASSGFGTGSAFGNQDFGGYFAAGGYLGPGKWGIAGENGPEPIYGGSTGVTVQPNGDGGQPPVININVQVGDIAGKSDVVRGMQQVRQQITGDWARSKKYGGAMAS